MSNPIVAALANIKRDEMNARESAAANVVSARLNLPIRNLRTDEWPVFEAFCAAKKLPACPAASWTVAMFILHEAHLGVERLLAVVEAVSSVHGAGIDPTFSPVVAAALNHVAPVTAPRSFSKEQKIRFSELTYPMQLYIAERELQRDRDIRRSHNKSAEQIAKLKDQLEKANATPETAPNAAATNA